MSSLFPASRVGPAPPPLANLRISRRTFNAFVTFSNVKFGDIGGTTDGTSQTLARFPSGVGVVVLDAPAAPSVLARQVHPCAYLSDVDHFLTLLFPLLSVLLIVYSVVLMGEYIYIYPCINTHGLADSYLPIDAF